MSRTSFCDCLPYNSARTKQMSFTNQATRILILHNVLFLGPYIALLQEIPGADASNSLTSSPPEVNGIITACVGDEISLTCSRNNSASALTPWIISSPVNCSSEVDHITQTASPSQCGPFTFQNITKVKQNVAQLSSTAVANASSEINGSVIECMSGIVMPVSVGNISLCLIDELPEPVNLTCENVPQGLSVTWDVVTDGNSSCARNTAAVIHDVMVVWEADKTVIFSMNNVKDTQIEITDSLEPSQNYSIQVRTKLIHGTCETGEATIVCRISDDLSPTTASSATEPETKKGNSVSAAAVAVPIVLILILVVAIVIGILIIFWYYKRYGKLPFNLTLPFRKLKDQNLENSPTSHPTKLTHTPAPSGVLYTDIDKATKLTGNTDHEVQPYHSNNGSSNDFVDESKDQDTKTDTEAKEEDKPPPPKPERVTKTKNKQPSDTKYYEEMDDF